ncbi:MAG: OmpA family protein [Spirochaetia bacterium]|nr:OmpA family protein [Spirochaetia bacterium]
MPRFRLLSRAGILLLTLLSISCVSTSTHEREMKTRDDENLRMQGEIERLETEKSQLIKDRTTLQASVQEMAKALEDARIRKTESDKRIADYRAMMARFRGLIDSGKLKIRMVDGRMVVVLSSDVLFSPGSADLSPQGRDAILEVARVFATMPDRKFQIEGHTDNAPIRTFKFPSNWQLASERAISVLDVMVQAGVTPDKVSAASYAETHPVKPNTTIEGRSANRRIEIVIVPDLSSLPGFDELNKLAEEK